MELEIIPEPSPAERVAIEAALAELAAAQVPRPSAWWSSGLPEPDDDPES